MKVKDIASKRDLLPMFRTVWGKIELAQDGPTRLALCREAGLYTSPSLTPYTHDYLTALLTQGKPSRRYKGFVW